MKRDRVDLVTPEKTSRVKRADSDQEFEQALSDLAYSQLASRCPKLFRYAVAFQVLDQADDRQKAVGVFLFKAGDKWFKVPVFYRDGQVRGTEILILDDDEYFPLSEEAVNFFLSAQDADHPGRGSPKSETNRYSAPSLWQLNTPPSKWAAARPLSTGEAAAVLCAPDARRAVPAPVLAATLRALSRAHGKEAFLRLPAVPSLEECVAGSAKLAAALGRLVTRYPLVARALARTHDIGKLAAAARRARDAAARPPLARPRDRRGYVLGGKRAADAKPAELRVLRVTRVTLTQLPVVAGLDLRAAERRELAAGRNVYYDTRADGGVTTVVDWGLEGSPGQVRNPERGTLVHELALAGGGDGRCVVSTAPVDTRGPLDDYVLVVRPGDKATLLAPRAGVWSHGTEPPDAVRAWADKLPEARDPADLPEHFLLIAPDSQVSVPFHKGGPARGAGGVAVYSDDAPAYDAPGWFQRSEVRDAPGSPPWDPTGLNNFNSRGRKTEGYLERPDRDRPQRVAFTGAPAGTFVTTQGCLYYPAGTRVLDLTGRDRDANIPLCGWGLGEDPLGTLQRGKRAALTPVTIRPGPDGYLLKVGRDAGASLASRHPCDLEADLVEAVGLRPADARRLVDRVREKGAAEVWVKRAAPAVMNMVTDQSQAPGFPFDFNLRGAGFADEVVPNTFNGSAAVNVTSTNPQYANYERYRPWPEEAGVGVDPMRIGGAGGGGGPPAGPEDDPDLLRLIADAGQSGRKELVDASALAGLVKYTDEDTVLARLLPPLRKTITALGQTLAHMEWNTDAYQERYGRAEVTNLVDRVRGQFGGLGELYLTLREKASDRVVASESVLPDLDNAPEGDTQAG